MNNPSNDLEVHPHFLQDYTKKELLSSFAVNKFKVVGSCCLGYRHYNIICNPFGFSNDKM